MTEIIPVDRLPRWDAADYLETPEAQAEYLSMIMEDGDVDEIRQALKAICRARGMRDNAEAASPDHESVSVLLGDDGDPAFTKVLEVIRALGLTLSAHASDREQSA